MTLQAETAPEDRSSADRPSSTGSTPRELLRKNRAAIALLASLVAVLGLLAVLTRAGTPGALDPDAYDPGGAHALATLLRDRGVAVQRTTDVPATQAAATTASTVFVPLPLQLSDEELTALAALPGTLVVAGALPDTLESLQSDEEVTGGSDVKALDPDCPLEIARNAGRAEVGGLSYQGDGTGCYPASEGPTLLVDVESELVLIGSADLFTNKRLAKQGNAALAIGLLGQSERVVWLIPAPDRAALGERPTAGPEDLLPDWLKSARLQLLVALGVLALWRTRRLGRVVPEPLPVVVRASETAEGRGRLYRSAGARDTAAEALRGGARARLGPRLGAGPNPDPDALTALVTARSSRPAGEIQALLYGPSPADDAALVRLADDLDTLIREVAGS